MVGSCQQPLTKREKPADEIMTNKPLSLNQALLLARTHVNNGDLEAAKQLYRAILHKFPGNEVAIEGLKITTAPMQQLQTLSLNQDQVNFLMGLYSQGQLDEALAYGLDLAEKFTHDPQLLKLLGAVYTGMGRMEEAVTSYQRALNLKPDDAEVYCKLGNCLFRLHRYEEAITNYHLAFSLDKKYISARLAMLYLSAHICKWDDWDASQSYLKSLELGSTPKETAPPFSLLFLIDDGRLQSAASAAYSHVMFKQNTPHDFHLTRHNSERIRIGYFSSDFNNHATMYLMAELFERHDQSKFEVHAFSFGGGEKDEMRSRLLKSVEHFHDVKLKNDSEIAELSRSLDIDIAIDLNGYTGKARPGIFSYRAAPIQVNYLGYPGTMGAPYFDYIIADSMLIPLTHQKFYSEKVVYLPNSYQANDSGRKISDKPVSRADFGLPEGAFVFCCFNVHYKITPDVFDIWIRLLNQVENSVLWLLKGNQVANNNLRKEALKRRIDPDRLIFADRMRLSEHLARHRLANLFLDTFNVNAHTTASDALWAGLPVLTKMGESFASRVAGSLLNAVELPELITTTPQAYEDTALMLATHPNELKALGEKLKHNLKTTALFDATLLTKHIENAYTEMFKRRNEGLEPDHIYIEK